MATLVKRSQWRAYINTGSDSTETLSLMGEGFTQIDESKNPVEYSRKYVHEDSERTDVVGYAPSLAYAIDAHSGDPAIKKLIDIHESEAIGTDAQVDIVSVNMFEAGETDGTYKAFKRKYAVIPDSKSGDNALTYSGNFKACGEKVPGTFTPASKTFTADA